MKHILLLFTLVLFSFLAVAENAYRIGISQDATQVQWYKAESFTANFKAISEATDTIYETNDPGIYYATYTLGDCNNASDYFIIVKKGSSVEFPITISDDTSPDKIQWYDGTSLLVGETTSDLIITAEGDYWAQVEKDNCPSTTPVFKFRADWRIPTAVDDKYTTVAELAGIEVSGNVITDNNMLGPENDDPAGEISSVSILASPTKGDVTIDNLGNFVYTSDDVSFIGTDSFTYILCNVSDQCDTATVYIEVVCRDDDGDLFVPTLLSPNNDGNNDVWKIPWLLTTGSCYEFNEVIVFNRWEVKVFQKRNYGLDGEWWDGRMTENNFVPENIDPFKGSLLPSGTYYYIIRLESDWDKAITGFIHIQY